MNIFLDILDVVALAWLAVAVVGLAADRFVFGGGGGR